MSKSQNNVKILNDDFKHAEIDIKLENYDGNDIKTDENVEKMSESR